MRSRHIAKWFSLLGLTIVSMVHLVAQVRGDDRLVGIWSRDEGFQMVELLFRSDGRYQLDKRSTDPVFDFASTDRGRYQVEGSVLTLMPYEYFGEPIFVRYRLQAIGTDLALERTDLDLTETYQFKPGSKDDVLAREQAARVLVGTWERPLIYHGKAEYTFRPGGYYFLKDTPDDVQFPPEYIRGRYEQNGNRLTVTPYSGTPREYELDFFGNTLTLIRTEDFIGEATAFEQVPGSAADIQAKATAAAAYLAEEHWQVGVWEVRDGNRIVDVTLRPDGHFIAVHNTEFLKGTVRGRYSLEAGRIEFAPFVGQDLYARSNGEFGKVSHSRALDYYDGELQFIDLDALSQSVTLARKRPGSEATVLTTAQQSETERARDGWPLGVWVVNDPTGWMEFTFRPDGCYIAKSGTDGVASRVERGLYVIGPNKFTLAPYAGLGPARGFEWDFFDGELNLAGDLSRLVVARKLPGSDAEVIEKTTHPQAMTGERGPILGRWSANTPGQNVELVFRPDGEFRLTRCQFDTVSRDYGLFAADPFARTLVSDSRFLPVQTLGLDFYGETLTIHGGNLGPPATFTVNLGEADAAIEASLAADVAEAAVDAQWLARVPVAPRDPNAVQIPTGNIPADPNPGHLFDTPTVLQNYQLYRRLIPGFVYFNDLGTIKSVAVVNTREWHFFPTGRVLVRFKNYYAGAAYPTTFEDVADNWGAYQVEPKPTEADILHRYADNGVRIETDLGERLELTLEDGRRHLFWEKDYLILSEWAAEQTPVPCALPANPDPNLMNTGVSLATSIPPDEIGRLEPMPITLTRTVSGDLTINGTASRAANLVIEGTTSLAHPLVWQALQTNNVAAGPFRLVIPHLSNTAAFFRVRGPAR